MNLAQKISGNNTIPIVTLREFHGTGIISPASYLTDYLTTGVDYGTTFQSFSYTDSYARASTTDALETRVSLLESTKVDLADLNVALDRIAVLEAEVSYYRELSNNRLAKLEERLNAAR